MAGGTLPALWRRHFLDSAQLSPLITPDSSVVDVGSGAGFPGLVLAILGHRLTLVESDKRKAAFLREAARRTGTDVTIFPDRVEKLAGMFAVVTARAFAPLPRLLAQTQHLVGNDSQYLLLKGQDIEEELTAATTSWKMQVQRHPSRTDPRGAIVQLTQVQAR